MRLSPNNEVTSLFAALGSPLPQPVLKRAPVEEAQYLQAFDGLSKASKGRFKSTFQFAEAKTSLHRSARRIISDVPRRLHATPRRARPKALQTLRLFVCSPA